VDVVHGVFADAVGAVFAVEGCFGRQAGELEGGGGDKNFQGRAGLERVRDGPVAPHGLFEIVVGVRVERRRERQGEDGARLGFHHHGHAGACPGRFHRLVQCGFGDELHGLVEGQDQVLAAAVGVRRRFGLEAVSQGVAQHLDAGVRAPQVAVVEELDALEAAAVHPGETDDLGGERPVRVEAARFGDELEAGHPQLPDRLDLFGGGLALDPHERFARGELFSHFRKRPLEDARYAPRLPTALRESSTWSEAFWESQEPW